MTESRAYFYLAIGYPWYQNENGCWSVEDIERTGDTLTVTMSNGGPKLSISPSDPLYNEALWVEAELKF